MKPKTPAEIREEALKAAIKARGCRTEEEYYAQIDAMKKKDKKNN